MNNKFAIGMLIILLTLTGTVGYFSYTYLADEGKNQAVDAKTNQQEENKESAQEAETKAAEQETEADSEPSTGTEADADAEGTTDEEEKIQSEPSNGGSLTVGDVMDGTVTPSINPSGSTNVKINDNYEVPREKLEHIQDVINKVHPQTDNQENNANQDEHVNNQSPAGAGNQSVNQPSQEPASEKPSGTNGTNTNQNSGATTLQQLIELPTIYDKAYVSLLVQSLKKDLVKISFSESTNKTFDNEVCYQAKVLWNQDTKKSYTCWIGSRTLKIYDENGERLGTIYSDLNQYFE